MSKQKRESRTLKVLGTAGTLASAAGMLYLVETADFSALEGRRPHATASRAVENGRIQRFVHQACSYSPDLCRLAETILKSTRK